MTFGRIYFIIKARKSDIRRKDSKGIHFCGCPLHLNLPICTHRVISRINQKRVVKQIQNSLYSANSRIPRMIPSLLDGILPTEILE